MFFRQLLKASWRLGVQSEVGPDTPMDGLMQDEAGKPFPVVVNPHPGTVRKALRRLLNV
jgi:hypothetical protein